ncbi:Piezo-type mechanosensitive ion channel component 1, partial [Eschrichtius robustus]|nr:Piezo-type mechanosensitive ion channel component 1 [Eschrichtius robustus]
FLPEPKVPERSPGSFRKTDFRVTPALQDRGHTGRLLRVLLGFSLLFLAAHLTFQICLHTMPHLDQLLGPSCSTWDTISRHIGVTRLDLKDVPSAIRLVAPDLGVLAASSLCLGVCRRRTQMARRSQRAQEPDDDDGDVDAGSLVGLQEAPALPRKRRSWLAARFRITAHWLLVAAGRTLAVVLLALAGIAHPSAFSSVYFLLFLTICTWWACHFPISPLGFSALCVMVGCFGTGHLLCLYCYQTPLAQSMLPPASIWARVFGLKDFVAPANCSSPNVLVLNTSHDWPVYVSPGILLLLCYTVTSLLKLRVRQPADWGKEAAGDDEEREVELTEVDRWPQGQARAAATKEEEATQHTMPVPVPPDPEDSCIVHDLTGHSAVQQRPSHPRLTGLKETSPLCGLGHLVMDQSYVCALIAMMVYYSLWRKLLKAFWWLVVAYTMLVLVAVYTFQFQDFPAYWRNLTGLTDEQLGDLGLEQFSVSELFSSILVPGFFLLACILQLHYFHRPFMQLTDPEHRPPPSARTLRRAHRQDTVSGTPLLQQEEEEAAPRDEGLGVAGPHQAIQVPEASKWGLVAERLLDLAAGFSDVLTRTQVLTRRLLELHVFKLVALYTVWVALEEVSVLNFLLVVLWAFALPYPRFRPMASCLATVWTCVIIVCKMLYQLKVVSPHEYASNCTEPFPNSTNLQKTEIHESLLYRGPIDPANWFGVRKGFPNLGYIQICFLMAVNVIGQRMNFMVILHGCWLVAILTRRRREAIARLWPNYCLFLALFLLYQYLLCLGIPPALCIDYPWRWSRAVPVNSALIRWLYLPDFFSAPNATNLISESPGAPRAHTALLAVREAMRVPAGPPCVHMQNVYTGVFPSTHVHIHAVCDVLLLLCAAQQWQVFLAERTEEWQLMAGVNTDRLEPLQGEPNPVPNFVHCRSYLDTLKVAVFRYLFWLVLVVVFVTGATRVSIFGLGYLLACFYLLLFGTSLQQKDTRARLVLWDCLILYNVTVIVSKNMLS